MALEQSKDELATSQQKVMDEATVLVALAVSEADEYWVKEFGDDWPKHSLELTYGGGGDAKPWSHTLEKKASLKQVLDKAKVLQVWKPTTFKSYSDIYETKANAALNLAQSLGVPIEHPPQLYGHFKQTSQDRIRRGKVTQYEGLLVYALNSTTDKILLHEQFAQEFAAIEEDIHNAIHPALTTIASQVEKGRLKR